MGPIQRHVAVARSTRIALARGTSRSRDRHLRLVSSRPAKPSNSERTHQCASQRALPGPCPNAFDAKRPPAHADIAVTAKRWLRKYARTAMLPPTSYHLPATSYQLPATSYATRLLDRSVASVNMPTPQPSNASASGQNVSRPTPLRK